jgi:hypothetical protein
MAHPYRGEPTDFLYDENVIMIPDFPLPILDEAFYRLFIESRSSSIRNVLAEDIFGMARSRELAAAASHEAMREIDPYRGLATKLIAKYNITAKNIFELGVGWGDTMAATILRAQ